MDRDTEQKITDLIGENLDRLITIDWRCLGQIHTLYEAARSTSDGPLAMRAAQRFVHAVGEGDVVFVMTGFPVTPLAVEKDGKIAEEHALDGNEVTHETDGVVAASVIARAVDIGLRANPVVFCEEECVEIARSCCEAAGLRVVDDFKASVDIPRTISVLPFPKDPHEAKGEAKRILDEMNPKATVSVERPGKNEKGHFHRMDGCRITPFVARIDELFEGIKERGGLTIAIGDLGNELGMGALKETTERVILYGDRCQCGCGGGIGTTSRADAIVFGAVSEDAAYAFLACLAHLLSQPEVLHSTEVETRVLQAAYSRGAVDGLSGLKGPWIDYLHVSNHNHQIELMRDIIQSPMRFFKLIPSFYRKRNYP